MAYGPCLQIEFSGRHPQSSALLRPILQVDLSNKKHIHVCLVTEIGKSVPTKTLTSTERSSIFQPHSHYISLRQYSLQKLCLASDIFFYYEIGPSEKKLHSPKSEIFIFRVRVKQNEKILAGKLLKGCILIMPNYLFGKAFEEVVCFGFKITN